MPPTRTNSASPNFQTVRLKRGRHISPEHGVCVMELASMLAGEQFTDHPRSVSPVIAAFLRAYNDLIDEDRRQDLYRFAAECVGTRASGAVEVMRAEWLPAAPRGGFGPRLRQRISFPGTRRTARAATAAATFAASPERHAEALELVEQLIALGAPDVQASQDQASSLFAADSSRA